MSAVSFIGASLILAFLLLCIGGAGLHLIAWLEKWSNER